MAKLKSGLWGNVSGNVGNVQGSNWKGKSVVCQKKSKYTKAVANSITEQRAAYSRCLFFYNSLKSQIYSNFYKDYSKRNSNFNNFFHLNLSNMKEDILSNDFRFIISSGSLPSQSYTISYRDDEEVFHFVRNGSALDDPSFFLTDNLTIVFFNPKSYSFLVNTSHRREENSFDIDVSGFFAFPDPWIHICCAFSKTNSVFFSQYFLTMHFNT